MQRERVTEDIYVFTSELYAQVTAGLIVTGDAAVLIDTLPYPEETKQIKQFAEERLRKRVSHVINTHFHADHTTGTCFFRDARVIGHTLCRELLDQRGRESMDITRATAGDMQDLYLVLPDITFDHTLTLYIGRKTLKLWASPGHSPDSVVCLIEEDQILFGADTVMPIPYFVDGNYDDFVGSIRTLQKHQYESIVQGHGEVILRGEVDEKLSSDLVYLSKLRDEVDKALLADDSQKALGQVSIEQCGKSRILLNGAAQQLHRQNVFMLADQRREQKAQAASSS
jgi:glyoxylase-like metal-dependent hydrolase (beta-lactamase superfamily II)